MKGTGIGALTFAGLGLANARENSPNNRQTWQYRTDGLILSSPTVVDSTVFIGSTDSNVYALDMNSGKMGWSFGTNAPVVTSPMVVDNTVFIGSNDGNVYALNSVSGTEKWVFETDGRVISSPTVSNSTVFVGSNDGNLYALDVDSGTKNWEVNVRKELGLANVNGRSTTERFQQRNSSFSISSPTVVDGTVFIQTGEGNVLALAVADGTNRWTFDPIGGTNRFISTIDDSAPNSNNGTSQTFSTDPSRLQEIVSVSVVPSPTVASGRVFVNSDDTVYALDTQNGNSVWKKDFETNATTVGTWFDGNFAQRVSQSAPTSSPTVADGILYIQLSDGQVVALDTEDGTKLWVFDTRSDTAALNTQLTEASTAKKQLENTTGYTQRAVSFLLRSSPTVAGGRLFVGGIEGRVHVLNISNGSEEWVFDMTRKVSSSTSSVDENHTLANQQDLRPVGSSPTIVDGSLFIGGLDGGVYAIDADVQGPSKGSRVILGTLGHHILDSPDEDIGDEEDPESAFNPAVHGFGFKNWSGTRAESAGADEQSFELPFEAGASLNRDDVIEAVNGWSGTPDRAVELLAEYIYAQQSRQMISVGHCYGMVFAAQYYHENPQELPEEVASASEIPVPTGPYEQVGRRIRDYQSSQLLNVKAYWLLRPAWRLNLVNYEAQLDALTNALDNSGSVGIGVTDLQNNTDHQLLAYDYEYSEDGSEVIVKYYDPVARASSYEEGSLTFRLSAQTGELVESPDSYTDYGVIDPGLSLELSEELIERDSVFDHLSSGVAFVLHSPASLQVDASDDATVITSTAEYEFTENSVASDAALVLNPTTQPEVTVVGDGSGEFELEMVGSMENQETIRDTVSGEISPDEKKTYIAQFTQNSDEETGLQPVQSEPADSDGSEGDGSNSNDGADRAGDDDSGADDSGPGLGVGSALTGIGGVGYLLKRRFDTENSE